MGLLGARTFTVTTYAAGAWADGDFTPGASSTYEVEATLRPLTDGRELEKLPELIRSRARYKLYSKARLKVTEPGSSQLSDRVEVDDTGDGASQLFEVASLLDNNVFSAPGRGRLNHYRYVLLAPEGT